MSARSTGLSALRPMPVSSARSSGAAPGLIGMIRFSGVWVGNADPAMAFREAGIGAQPLCGAITLAKAGSNNAIGSARSGSKQHVHRAAPPVVAGRVAVCEHRLVAAQERPDFR